MDVARGPAALKRWLLRHRAGGLGLGGGVLVVLVLSAQLRSGYYSDDAVNSNLRGAARLHGEGLWWVLTESTRMLFRDQGRVPPLAVTYIALPHYLLDRLGYKVSILAWTLLVLGVFCLLVRELTRSGFAAALAALCAPAFFQTRLGSDPILCFHWVMQLVTLFTLLSLWQWARYLRLGRRTHLAWSLLAYGGANGSYEIAFAFWVLHAGLALTTDKPWAARWRDLRTCGLFALVTLGMLGLFIAARVAAGMPWQGVNRTYTPSFEALPYLMTVLRQSSAALPLSYPLLGHLRPTEVFTLDMAWAWLRGHWGWVQGLLVAGSTGLFAALARLVPEGRPRLLPLVPLGLLLWILPGVMIAFSPKYRAQDWVSWGNGYLPVFASIFGVLALLTAALAWASARVGWLATPGLPRIAAGAALGLLLGGVAALTASDTDYVVTQLDRQFRDPRDVAEAAMAAGLFEGVPDDAYLLLGSDAMPGALTSFYSTHLPLRFRRVASPGHYLGEPYASFGYFSEMHIGHGLEPLPLPEAARRGETSEGSVYAFTPEDRVWYFVYAATAPGRGAAVLGRVRGLVATSAQLHQVRADQVSVFQLGGGQVQGVPTAPPSATATHDDGAVSRWSDLPPPGFELLQLRLR